MKSCLSEDILQAYLDHELTQEASDEVAAHLAVCVTCAVQHREAEQIWMVIDGACASDFPESVPTARLRARIESALAESATPSFSLVWLWNWKLAAVAAAVLLALSVLFFRSTSEIPLQAIVPAPVSTADKQITSSIPNGEVVLPKQVLQPGKRLTRRPPASKAVETEIVTPFFPLRAGEDLSLLENAQLMRVELPGSALSEMGILVDPETAQIPVTADVVLGQDGLARAIRFVR